tara:strand:- start:236 stop:958 length:723 start_codon:yes stop_codon:yes gene_type:complete
MCIPAAAIPFVIAGAQFALQAGGAIAGQRGKEKAVEQRNDAKLANWDLANRKYDREVLLRNNNWKNDVLNTERELDSLIQDNYDQWNQQDAELEALALDYSFRQQETIVNMYKDSYAGTLSGVTAARLAAQPVKEAGLKRTEALAKVMLSSDQTTLAKERIWNNTRRKRLLAWEKTRWAPEHGWRPEPPVLEGKPGKGQMLLDIAIAGVGAASGIHAGLQQQDTSKALKDLVAKKAKGKT